MTERFDLLVIGGGGAGSETAFRVGESRSLRVGIVERDKLGGECNNYGCVPTKAMLKAAKVVATARKADVYGITIKDIQVDFPKVMERVRGIVTHFSRYGPTPFEEIGVRVFLGPTARFTSPQDLELDDGTQLTADRVVVATGTKAAIPPIDGLRDSGCWTNEEAVAQEKLPGSIAIVGGGPIGLEFAQVFARLGSRVTVIEALDRILSPEDPEASAVLHEALEADGVTVLAAQKLERVERNGSTRRLHIAGGSTIDADEILVAVGRTPSFGLLEHAKAGIELDERGRPVLDESLRTTAKHIWCAGDATGDLLFTHVASYEGQIVAQQILSGAPVTTDYRIVPRVTYTDPEVASVGLTEAQARDGGIDVRIGMTRFEDNERAYIDGEMRGFVKIVCDAATGEIVGGHVTGTGAGDLIHAVVALMAGRTPARVGGDAIHAYPTLAESLKSALQQASD